jgi:complement component 6
MSLWTTWTECSKSCDTGSQLRMRTAHTAANYGGIACPTDVVSSRSCSAFPCTSKCLVSAWHSWTTNSSLHEHTWNPCSKSCGEGTQSRFRSVTWQELPTSVCPPLEETQTCNSQPCARDCVVTAWTQITMCSRSCGMGIKTRERTISTRSAFHGKACPKLNDIEYCNAQPCPSHCRVSAYSDWSDCSVSCGGGTSLRHRSILDTPAHGGTLCPALVDIDSCNTALCAVDCEVSHWSEWSECSELCGTSGTQISTRSIKRVAAEGGKDCPGTQNQQPCNIFPCPIDCELSLWTEWGPCSVTCGGAGIENRTRTVITEAVHDGKLCDPNHHEHKTCNDGPCPIHCEVTEWSAWSTCTATCGEGTQDKSRSVITHDDHGGYQCPTLSDYRACNLNHCEVDCKVTAFGQWSSCSRSCGGGFQTQDRTVITQPAYGGAECPMLQNMTICANSTVCPTDCEMTTWGIFSVCSKSCGSGSKIQRRSIAVVDAHGGEPCGDRFNVEMCNTQPCPIDCNVNEWSVWTACSRTCGGGHQTRARQVTTYQYYGGKACPSAWEHQTCNLEQCPVACVMDQWSSYSSCSTSCGIGYAQRTRSITVPARNGALPCGLTSQTETSTQAECAVD